MSSIVAVSVYIPTRNAREYSLFSMPSPAFVVCRLLDGGHSDQSEKAMATHSSTLAWKFPRTEEPGRLQSMGSHRVGHD